MIWHHLINWLGHLEGAHIHYVLAAICFVYGLGNWNRQRQSLAK